MPRHFLRLVCFRIAARTNVHEMNGSLHLSILCNDRYIPLLWLQPYHTR